MNPQDLDIISQIAGQKLGAAPAPAGAPPADPAMQQGQAPAAPPAPPKADPAPTNMEMAQAKVAPTDPAKQDASKDVQFVKLGDREYTDAQLMRMMDSYKKVNYEHQTNKPIMQVVKQMMEQAKAAGHDAKPEEMASLVQAAMDAFIKNPQMGGKDERPNEVKQTAQQSTSSNEDVDASLADWAKKNAVDIPPGLMETMSGTKAMSKKMDDMMAMFKQVIEGGLAGQTATQQATQQTQQAQAVKADAGTQLIANNLNNAFQQAGLSPDPQTRADFRMFAAQRGYDFPDFMDAEMTATVVADYKANKDAPEINRLREIASKRQAFTGMMDGTPAGGNGSPAPAGDPMLAQLVNSTMQRKNMM